VSKQFVRVATGAAAHRHEPTPILPGLSPVAGLSRSQQRSMPAACRRTVGVIDCGEIAARLGLAQAINRSLAR